MTLPLQPAGKSLPHVSFRTRLTAGVLLLNLFVIALAGLSAHHNYHNSQRRAETTTQNLAQVLESKFTDSFQRIDIALLAVLDDYERQRAAGRIDAKALDAAIEQFHSRLPEMEGLRITDAQGRLIYNKGIDPATRIGLADRTHFLPLRDDPKAGLVIPNLQIHLINNKQAIILARRITQPDGSPGGIVFAAITLDHIYQLFASLDLGPGSVLSLRDDDLRLIARYPELKETDLAIGSRNASPELQKLHAAGKTAATYRTQVSSDNLARTLTFHKIKDYPLYVSVGLAASDYLAAWRDQASELAMMVALFLLATLFAARLQYRAWKRQQESGEILLRQKSALRESEEKLRALFELSPLGIVLTDMDGRHIEFNEAFRQICGFSAEELKALDHWTLTPEKYQAEEAAQLDSLDRTGRYGPYEKEYRRKDGYLIPLRIYGTIVTLSDNQRYVWSIVEDITEHKLIEAALHASEQKFRQQSQRLAEVIWATNTGTWEWNVQTGEAAFNERWTEIAGHTLDELAPVSIDTRLKLIHPADLKHSDELLERCFSRETEIYKCEVRMRHRNGNWVWVLERGRVVEWTPDGKPLRMSGTTQDVTARKQTRDALQLAKEQAETALRAESEFLANMSHEIRTPISSMLGMVQLALDTAIVPNVRALLEKAQLSGEHLLNIINDILDFSQIEAGKLNIEKVDFHLDEIKQKLLNLIGEKAARKGLALTFDLDPAISHRLHGDPLRLSQILLNYVNNAIKFTERGEIIVRARNIEKGEDHFVLRFEVQDNGIGMTRAETDRLFRPFQQADRSTTRKYGGSGLGLAISKRLAELMDGEVGVESEVGKGSTFWFSARFDIGKGDKTWVPAAEAASTAEVAAALNGALILLVEDDPFNQEVADMFLQRAGVDVFIAHNGAEALELLRQQHFDCVLMDIQMPVMDGLEAIRQIRRDPALAGLRVIAMTANASNRDRERFLAAGMDDFISKPFKPPALYAKLAKWLPAPPPQKSPAAPLASPAVETALAGEPKIIDFAEIANFVGNDPKDIREFALRFIASAWTDIATIDAALEHGDMAAMGAIAHRMTTPALMVGATRFAELCKGLKSGKNSDSVQRARDIANQLRTLLESMEAQVKKA